MWSRLCTALRLHSLLRARSERPGSHGIRFRLLCHNRVCLCVFVCLCLCMSVCVCVCVCVASCMYASCKYAYGGVWHHEQQALHSGTTPGGTPDPQGGRLSVSSLVGASQGPSRRMPHPVRATPTRRPHPFWHGLARLTRCPGGWPWNQKPEAAPIGPLKWRGVEAKEYVKVWHSYRPQPGPLLPHPP